MKKKNLIRIAIASSIGIIVIVVIGIFVRMCFFSSDNKTEIITESKLYEISNVSKLSTYQCVYNGICTVTDEDKKDEVLYYCSYDAKVNAGIEFDQVKISVDNERKKVNVSIPLVEITDVNVDIATLDYMFVDEKQNKSTITEKAYKACIADVEKKSKEESKIEKFAQQNAMNTIEALIKPFIEQLDSEYILNVSISDEKEATR